jgi:hypothetical protein
MADRFSSEFDVERRQGEVSMYVDMTPSTVLEVNLMGGYSRTTKPVGQAPADGINTNGSASRGTTDAIAAAKLGLPVVNKR